MITIVLHKIFAAVRFVQLEWAMWIDQEERQAIREQARKLREVKRPS